MARRDNVSTFMILFVTAFVLLGMGGWVANIVKLFSIIDDPVTAMTVLRGIGVFVAPLGAILGFM